MKLVLASSSIYRRELLERLQLDFVTAFPDINESKRIGESPREYVKRLSIEKSQVLGSQYPDALIIGSDQIILTDKGEIQGKPITHKTATQQLKQIQGSKVDLITGLALYNSKTKKIQSEIVEYEIGYRNLSDTQIEDYLLREKPYNCAGSLKSEGLGICLLTYLRGDDPTAIIGLPLIKLTDMLQTEGIEFLK